MSPEARRAKEREGLATFQSKTAPRIHSLKDLHAFLFQEHMAYASKRLMTVGSLRTTLCLTGPSGLMSDRSGLCML
jgi:hypothetical protein